MDPRIVEAAFRLPRPDAGKPAHGSVALRVRIAVFALVRVTDADARKVDAASAERRGACCCNIAPATITRCIKTSLRQQAEIIELADQL